MMVPSLADRIVSSLVFVPDFPIVGFNFPDITPLLERDPQLYRDVIQALVAAAAEWKYDTLLCIESFGYIFGAPIAYEKGVPQVLMRRSGKLPRPTIERRYDMCYDRGRRMSVHRDAIRPGSKVLIIDDFLASGGTIGAASEIVIASAARVAGAVCVAEIPELGGRATLRNRFGFPLAALARVTICRTTT